MTKHTLIQYGVPTPNGRTYNQRSFASLPTTLLCYLEDRVKPSLAETAGTVIITSDQNGIYGLVTQHHTPAGKIAWALPQIHLSPVSIGRMDSNNNVYDCQLLHILITPNSTDDLIPRPATPAVGAIHPQEPKELHSNRGQSQTPGPPDLPDRRHQLQPNIGPTR